MLWWPTCLFAWIATVTLIGCSDVPRFSSTFVTTRRGGLDAPSQHVKQSLFMLDNYKHQQRSPLVPEGKISIARRTRGKGRFYRWKYTSLCMTKKRSYQLGLGKNKPIVPRQQLHDAANKTAAAPPTTIESTQTAVRNWNYDYSLSKETLKPSSATSQPPPPAEEKYEITRYDVGLGKNMPIKGSRDDGFSKGTDDSTTKKKKKLVAKDEASEFLSRAVWDKGHYEGNRADLSIDDFGKESAGNTIFNVENLSLLKDAAKEVNEKELSGSDDVWETLREEARREAEREPLLVSFLFSSILNHKSLESALAFHLANRLSSPAMISTQVMSLFLEALRASPEFRKSLREDMLAVRERDPACTALPDVFLYFKGFHALQTYRVAHYLWKNGRKVLAHYLQSQMSQVFQIDIHPNATLGSGIMLDHGTGIVIGETAVVGHNCSILHHVTLGGSGKKGNDRHPKIGEGVLLGAGTSILGNIRVGNGCQVGAGTLVLDDLPERSVAVGVPAKIIGSFVDVNTQPSKDMNQVGSQECDRSIKFYATDGI